MSDRPGPARIGVREAAERLGLTAQRIRQLCQSGTLAAIKDDGEWWIDRTAVDAYAARPRRRRPDPSADGELQRLRARAGAADHLEFVVSDLQRQLQVATAELAVARAAQAAAEAQAAAAADELASVLEALAAAKRRHGDTTAPPR